MIPNGVTTIEQSAFAGCSRLTSINIPDSVTSIGNEVFYGCSGITSITIPNGITSIGGKTFQSCSGLMSITILSNVISIGNYAFYNCKSLAIINYTGTQTQWDAISKGSDWNYGCPANMIINCLDMVFVKGKNNVSINGKTVTIDDFYMCDHEVTQKEFAQVFPEHVSHFNSDFIERYYNNGNVQNDEWENRLDWYNESRENHPVDSISWYKAVAYCNKRSAMEGLEPYYTVPRLNTDWKTFSYSSIPTSMYNQDWDFITCNVNSNGYRLPTGAEWIYAKNGGEHLDNYTYSGSNDMMEVAWCFGMADYPTHEVKLKKPNSLGIYDMNGNVCEWCFDWDYLNSEAYLNGVNNESFHKLKGGGDVSAIFNDDLYPDLPGNYGMYNGLRVVRNLPN